MSCTLQYAPPEAVCAGLNHAAATVNPAVDVWALGAVVFECLAAQPTFTNAADADAPWTCACGDTRYPWERADVPCAWRKARARPVIERCLQRDAGKRPSAAALLRELQSLDDAMSAATPRSAEA